jgi:pSer/pThr/pTyr-binding forkhead associated (FHA) protein
MLKPLSPQLSRSIQVARQVCVVGSHPRVHLPLHSPMISRTHALIVIDGPETYIRDLASRNGLYLNGHVVREVRLRHGDLVCVGPYAFWWSALPLPSPRPRHLALSAPPPALLFPSGESEPQPMAGHTFLIGSRPDCDFVADNCMADPAHAVIYRKSGTFYLRDLNSKTGTFVNSRRARKAELRRGDEIRVGLTRLRFEPPDEMLAPSDGQLTEESRALIGLAATTNADHPRTRQDIAQRTCPTIEQLLGAAPTRITHWEQPRVQQRLDDLSLPHLQWLDLA